jgi:NAD-dependent SIR2 family protein deacetylase
MSRPLTDFDFVMSMLVQKMYGGRNKESTHDKPGVVFLLGAGCSRQYGLPGFRELLADIWEDCFQSPPEPSWSLDVLRDKIDQYWHSESPDFLRRRLDFYLRRAHGASCPGYRRLAQLARDGYIKAIVNMNFDLLLEEAFDAEGFKDYKVSATFVPHPTRRKGNSLIIYKPHGSIGRVDYQRPGTKKGQGDLILDIANSDIFAHPEEQSAAQDLMTSSDVVIVGYAGGDAKIAEALRGFKGRDPRSKKLFVINLLRPDPRLLPAIAERASHYLTLTGEDAAFENFTEHLEKLIRQREETGGRIHLPTTRAQWEEQNSMTRAERMALASCLRCAVSLRLAMNVAERSSMSIEEHGKEIYRFCLKLARNAGICLSSPEKYLLHCVAFLHDIGYYRGYSRNHASESLGWALLRFHGRMTRDLLEERRQADPDCFAEIIPTTYYSSAEERRVLEDVICCLCEGHTGLIPSEVHPAIDVRIGGIKVPIRFFLLLSLFALAEDLAEGHPFLPSPDPVGPESEHSRWALFDPVLDLYLRRKKEIVVFKMDRGRILAKVKTGWPDAIAHWFLAMANSHVARFNEAAIEAGGWGMDLLSDPPDARVGEQEINHLLELALEARLDESLRTIVRRDQTIESVLCKDSRRPVGEVISLLDLVLIYTIPHQKNEHSAETEPRVDFRSEVVGNELSRVTGELRKGPRLAHETLLYHYLTLKRSGCHDEMDAMFVRSFEEIIHPAWRFFARNWHDGIESLLMARACLELGSSRFRIEVAGGLKDLIRSKLKSDKREVLGTTRPIAFGHDECTLCTSRLLFILSHAKRLFPRYEGRGARTSSDGRWLDQSVAAILHLFLSRQPDDDAWWGLKESPDRGYAIRSADYLAWAARSVAFCLSVDQEIRQKTGEEWLASITDVPRKDLLVLLRQRWSALWGADATQLLSGDAEEPYSFILGRVALTYLDLQGLFPQIREIVMSDLAQVNRFLEELRSASREVRGTGLSQMSQFYLWPAQIVEHSSCEELESEDLTLKLVRLCQRCVGSRVWIREGTDSGSWGFNVKNTQSIVMSLVAFWRYVLEDEERCQLFRKAFAQDDHGIVAGASISAPSSLLPEPRPGFSRASGSGRPRPRRGAGSSNGTSGASA